jgi:adenosylhomocysteine nucleosidase
MVVKFDPTRHISRMGDLDVLFVMATRQEYGPHLQALIDPLITGVGPVEAAASLGAALAILDERGRLPDLVLAIGSAGSRTLDHAGIYQASSFAYRDIDASALGIPKGVTPFLDEPGVVPAAVVLPGVARASISTGGAVVSGAAYDLIDADMVDMESFALYRAASRFAVPVISLRGISDGRGELTGLHDWTEFLHILDEKLAAVVARFRLQAEAGEIAARS